MRYTKPLNVYPTHLCHPPSFPLTCGICVFQVESGGSHCQELRERYCDRFRDRHLKAMSMRTLKTRFGLYPNSEHQTGCDSISLTLMEVVQKIQSEGMLSSYALML